MILLVISLVFSVALGAPLAADDNLFPNIPPTPEKELLGQDKVFWNNDALDALQKSIKYEEGSKRKVAKNVVFFVGDGMGVSTVTATRIYQGQRDYMKSGEDHRLVYDNFPNVALVKTYNVDMQVPDSAGTATALFSGIKTRSGSIGVDVKADSKSPNGQDYEESKLETIMTWAQRANKDTGVITTTRITHATPACTYARVHNRDWECDSYIPTEFKPFVKDIAYQLIEEEPGKNFKVILGGGYLQFGHVTDDPSKCIRTDGLNLTRIWIEKHQNDKAAFVTNTEGLDNVGDVDYLFGLFSDSHVPYELLRDRSPLGTPSLSQMTKKGLDILKRSPNGFVLMVEGGRIDHGHHDNRARLALEESSEFERTIAMVVDETDSDTLIIVTADHSHSLTLNGYSRRGNDILGHGMDEEYGNKPALTLTYANGPGFSYHHKPGTESVLGPWLDVRTDANRLNNAQYAQMATYYLPSETHGGEDVAVFATGPGSNLIRGVVEQSYLPHVVSYAACIGPRAAMNPQCTSSSIKLVPRGFFIALLLFIKSF